MRANGICPPSNFTLILRCSSGMQPGQGFSHKVFLATSSGPQGCVVVHDLSREKGGKQASIWQHTSSSSKGYRPDRPAAQGVQPEQRHRKRLDLAGRSRVYQGCLFWDVHHRYRSPQTPWSAMCEQIRVETHYEISLFKQWHPWICTFAFTGRGQYSEDGCKQ
jgi:hypothetical protein